MHIIKQKETFGFGQTKKVIGIKVKIFPSPFLFQLIDDFSEFGVIALPEKLFKISANNIKKGLSHKLWSQWGFEQKIKS